MSHKKTAILVAVVLLLVSIVGSYAFGVANPSPNPPALFDVSWLHTTKEDASDLVWVTYGTGGIWNPIFSNATKGYREITMKFYVWEGKDAEFLVLFGIEGPKGSTSFVIDEFAVARANYDGVVKTYPVQGSIIYVRARSSDPLGSSRVILWFYMTT